MSKTETNARKQRIDLRTDPDIADGKETYDVLSVDTSNDLPVECSFPGCHETADAEIIILGGRVPEVRRACPAHKSEIWGCKVE